MAERGSTRTSQELVRFPRDVREEYTRAVACTNASSSSSLLISTALLSIPFHLQHFSWSFTGRGATTRRRFSFSFFFYLVERSAQKGKCRKLCPLLGAGKRCSVKRANNPYLLVLANQAEIGAT